MSAYIQHMIRVCTFYVHIFFVHIFVEQLCEAPPNVANADVTTNNTSGSKLLYANTTVASYSCHDGYFYVNGSLDATCSCDNYTNFNECLVEPDWLFPDGEPICNGTYTMISST